MAHLRLSVVALPVDAWQAAQLDSAFSDAEDWGDTLDSLLVKKDAERTVCNLATQSACAGPTRTCKGARPAPPW